VKGNILENESRFGEHNPDPDLKETIYLWRFSDINEWMNQKRSGL